MIIDPMMAFLVWWSWALPRGTQIIHKFNPRGGEEEVNLLCKECTCAQETMICMYRSLLLSFARRRRRLKSKS